METPQQTVGRLIGALEELSREEQVWRDQFAYEEVLAIQERESPLVNKIAELMLNPGVASSLDPDIHRRAHRLLDKQKAQSSELCEEMKTVQEKLRVLEKARLRADQVRPAYGQKTSPVSLVSFSAEG